jgi:hypothetical protein
MFLQLVSPMGLILTKHTSPVGCRGPDLWAQAVLPGGSSIRSSTTSDSSTFARPPSTRVLPQNPSGPRARHGVAKRDDGQLHHNGHDNRRRRRRAREQALQWRGFHHLRWQGAAAGGGRDDRPGPSTGEAAAEAPAPVRESLPRRSPLRSHVSLLLLAFRGSGFGGDWFVAVWRVDWLTSELAWVFFFLGTRRAICIGTLSPTSLYPLRTSSSPGALMVISLTLLSPYSVASYC